jgi:hypothetical protein
LLTHISMIVNDLRLVRKNEADTLETCPKGLKAVAHIGFTSSNSTRYKFFN